MLNCTRWLLALSTLGCADAELPSERPYICGRITSRTSAGWLVETVTPSNAPGAEPAADVRIGAPPYFGSATERSDRAAFRASARGVGVDFRRSSDHRAAVVSARVVVLEAPAAGVSGPVRRGTNRVDW
jgi:hypothetical protein